MALNRNVLKITEIEILANPAISGGEKQVFATVDFTTEQLPNTKSAHPYLVGETLTVSASNGSSHLNEYELLFEDKIYLQLRARVLGTGEFSSFRWNATDPGDVIATFTLEQRLATRPRLDHCL